MARKPKIAIIGGGIGGLTAALACNRHGLDVQVYERASAIGEIGAGVTLSPNAVKAYRALGIEAYIGKIGFESEGQIVRKWDTGEILSRVHRKGMYQKEFGAPYLSMHRADLVEALASNLPTDLIFLSKLCTEAETVGDKAVARFEDGSEIEADLIVGADGIHSTVRRSVFGPQGPRFTGVVCWRGLVPYELFRDSLLGTDLNLYVGPKKHLIHYMVRRGELINFVAHVETDSWTGESWTEECDRSEVLEAFEGWHDPLLELIGAADHYYKWALYDRDPLDHWSNGRITLLGDSVHAMPPFIGQGACMAIEDGFILASAIHRSPEDLETALAAYERIRVPRANGAVFKARERGRELHMTSEWNLKEAKREDKTGIDLHAYYAYDVTDEAQFDEMSVGTAS